MSNDPFESGKYCANCDRLFEVPIDYCHYCGRRLSTVYKKEEIVEKEASVGEKEEPEDRSGLAQRRCLNCSRILEEMGTRCSFCGADVPSRDRIESYSAILAMFSLLFGVFLLLSLFAFIVNAEGRMEYYVSGILYASEGAFIFVTGQGLTMKKSWAPRLNFFSFLVLSMLLGASFAWGGDPILAVLFILALLCVLIHLDLMHLRAYTSPVSLMRGKVINGEVKTSSQRTLNTYKKEARAPLEEFEDYYYLQEVPTWIVRDITVSVFVFVVTLYLILNHFVHNFLYVDVFFHFLLLAVVLAFFKWETGSILRKKIMPAIRGFNLKKFHYGLSRGLYLLIQVIIFMAVISLVLTMAGVSPLRLTLFENPSEEEFRDNHLLQYAFLLVILAPITEEIFFRSFVQHNLSRYYGTGTGLWISALGAAILHLSGRFIFIILLVNLFFAYVYAKQKNVTYPIILHMLYNFAILIIVILIE